MADYKINARAEVEIACAAHEMKISPEAIIELAVADYVRKHEIEVDYDMVGLIETANELMDEAAKKEDNLLN